MSLRPHEVAALRPCDTPREHQEQRGDRLYIECVSCGMRRKYRVPTIVWADADLEIYREEWRLDHARQRGSALRAEGLI